MENTLNNNAEIIEEINSFEFENDVFEEERSERDTETKQNNRAKFARLNVEVCLLIEIGQQTNYSVDIASAIIYAVKSEFGDDVAIAITSGIIKMAFFVEEGWLLSPTFCDISAERFMDWCADRAQQFIN